MSVKTAIAPFATAESINLEPWEFAPGSATNKSPCITSFESSVIPVIERLLLSRLASDVPTKVAISLNESEYSESKLDRIVILNP